MMRRIHHALSEMWGHRYDVDFTAITCALPGMESPKHIHGPIVVDLGHLAAAETEMSALIQMLDIEPEKATLPERA